MRRPSSSPAIVPYEEERPDIVRVMRALYSPEAEAGYAELRLRPGQPGVRVPVSLLDLLASACFQMQFGASIRLRTIRDQLTLEEAADLLGIDRLVLTNGISSGDLHPTLVDAPELASGDVLTLLRRERGGALVDLKELLPPDIEDA